MTTKRNHGPAGTDLAAALLIFVAGAAFGAVSMTVLGMKATTKEQPLRQELPASEKPTAQQGEPILEPDSPAADDPAVPAVYRGVVAANDGTALKVEVVEGVASPVTVTLTAAASAKITALVPDRTATSSGTRTADGALPPPLKPTSSAPYKEEPRRMGDFKAGDVVEFGADAGLQDGATVEVTSLTWIFSTAKTNSPGSMGDGGASPLRSPANPDRCGQGGLMLALPALRYARISRLVAAEKGLVSVPEKGLCDDV